MKPVFKFGDRVWAGQHPAKITSVRENGGEYYCTVKFDDTKLIPSEMEYEECLLKLEYSKEKHCPICGGEYKVVKFNMRVWKDCLNCKDTQENLNKRYADEKYNKIKSDSEEKENAINLSKDSKDLLKEFEKMLDDADDDDDDWAFGF